MKNGSAKQSNSSPAENANAESEKSTRVTVHFPDEIGIELVQANELKHYELFQWLVALIAPIAVGFWTAYAAEDPKPEPLWWSALAFSVLTVLFVLCAFYYRRKVYRGSIIKSILLKDFE